MGSARLNIRIVLLLGLTTFITALGNYSVQPFLPLMAEDLDSTVPLVGQAATVPLVVAAVAGLVAGPLADFLGYRRIAVAGLALVSLGAAATGLAVNYELLMAARVLAGFGAAATVGTSFAVVGVVHRQPARQQALSYIAASLSISAVIGIPLLTTAEAFLGWRGATLAIGVGGAGLTIALALFLDESPSPSAAGDHRPSLAMIVRAYGPLLRDPRMVRYFAALAGVGVATIGTVTYLGAYFDEVFGTSTGWIGPLFALAGGSYTAGSVLGGTRLFDFRHAPTLVVLGLAGGACFGAALAAGFGVALTVAILVLALLCAGVVNVLLVTALSVESASGAATTMALQASVANLGSALGIAAGGMALGLGGYGSLGVMAGLAMAATGLLAAGGSVALRREPDTGREGGAPAVGDVTRPSPGEGERR